MRLLRLHKSLTLPTDRIPIRSWSPEVPFGSTRRSEWPERPMPAPEAKTRVDEAEPVRARLEGPGKSTLRERGRCRFHG